MAKILIVDDDRQLVDVLTAALSRYSVIYATDGAGALHQVAAEHPDLVMLDLRLPGMDGAVLLPRIRELSDVPVIVLSARHEQQDIVQALNAGADDFVEKPFELNDLEARIEAVLRRSRAVNHGAPSSYTVGRLTVLSARYATLDGKHMHLSPIDHGILLNLARYPGQVVTRQQLWQDVWGTIDGMTEHVVDVHISVLRRQLRRYPGAPTIANVRGRGYLLIEGKP